MQLREIQYVIVLSRVLWGSKHDGYNPWYAGHLSALEKGGYITNADPDIVEQRGYFMIMIQRVAQKLAKN